jgi:hypothetical protein
MMHGESAIMMHMTERQLYALNEAHRDDLRRQVENERLARVAQSDSQPAYAAALSRLGNALVVLGERLQERYEPEPQVS